MPIQIIDNFDLNAEKAIDNRMVVGPTPSFYHNKNDIPNKYPGLRIWELPGAELGGGATNSTLNGLSYAWTGTQWISENTTAIGGGAANTLRVPYFSAINTILDTDLRYNISDKNFGFSVDPDTGASSPLNNIARIRVDGNVVISGKFIGNAGGLDNGIFNINASNIDVGTMEITRLGGDVGVGYILTSNGINSASYKIPSSINVGSATQLQNPRFIYGNTFNGTADVTGNLVFGQNSGKATILYNQTTARTLTIPSVGGNRTFSFIDQPETITATKTFTANISLTYVGAQPGDPVSLTAQGAYFGGVLTADSAINLNGNLTITHTNPNPTGSGNLVKLRITEGVNTGTTSYWWVTFGPESGSTNLNSPRIRAGNSSALNPSYTWRGDENTGIYWPSAGVIGFTIDGVERSRLTNEGLKISTDFGSPLVIDGGSSGFSCITLKSSVSDSVVSTPSGLLASAQIGHTVASSTTLTISNEIGKSIVFRSAKPNSGGGNVELKLALNNGPANAGPELAANQPDGLIIYNGGWRNAKANLFIDVSDERVKKDIKIFDKSVLDDVMKIKTITYDLINDDDDTKYLGFSAQNLFEINPLLVVGDTSDIYGELTHSREGLGVNTRGIVAILTNAIKELTLKVKELESKK